MEGVPFLGTLTNAVSVGIGSLVGAYVGKAFPKDLRDQLQKLLGVITLGLAVSILLEGELIKAAFTLVGGYVIGYALNLEGLLRKLGAGGGVIGALIIFCSGPMTVLGSINDAFGRSEILLVKALLDGTVSVIFAAALGPKMLLTVPLLIVIQGGIGVGALIVGGGNPDLSVLNPIGGLILLLIGLNLLEVLKFPIANTLPALILAPLWHFF
ncbi:MAG: DUF554 domain-containing protein [Thermotogae bacterium]|nr:DUF554 domain-containing protein [Thermotogota bacterium]